MVTKARLLLPAILVSFLAGCTTVHQPRYGYDGVYYEQAVSRHSSRVVHVDPLLYPYWSIDYFYFSRHYHPYSVWVGAADPWFYPYPGWYYGYRPGPRSRVGLAFGTGVYYPWFGFGYYGYQPWGWTHIHYPRYTTPAPSRVRHIDERLRMLEDRQRSARMAATPMQAPPPGRSVTTPSQTLTADEPGERQLQRAAVRERHGSATQPRATQPRHRRDTPGSLRQPIIVTSPQREQRSRRETLREPAGQRTLPDSQRQPTERGPVTAPPRETLRAPPQRQPQAPPARTQPSTPPQTQPAPPPARPAAPARSSTPERSPPARSRVREREREP